MMIAQAVSQSGVLTYEVASDILTHSLSGRFKGQKVLVLIPDHPRSLPLPELFRTIVAALHDARELNFMVALGTHPPLLEESLLKLAGITAAERHTTYRQMGVLN